MSRSARQPAIKSTVAVDSNRQPCRLNRKIKESSNRMRTDGQVGQEVGADELDGLEGDRNERVVAVHRHRRQDGQDQRPRLRELRGLRRSIRRHGNDRNMVRGDRTDSFLGKGT